MGSEMCIRDRDTSVPTLSSVSISSNNANRSMATPTDVVMLSFTASETIQSPTVTFLSGGAAVNGNISVSNTGGNNWAASFTTVSNDTAGPVTFGISFNDLAGNAGTAVTTTKTLMSPLQPLPFFLPSLPLSPVKIAREGKARTQHQFRMGSVNPSIWKIRKMTTVDAVILKHKRSSGRWIRSWTCLRQ